MKTILASVLLVATISLEAGSAGQVAGQHRSLHPADTTAAADPVAEPREPGVRFNASPIIDMHLHDGPGGQALLVYTVKANGTPGKTRFLRLSEDEIARHHASAEPDTVVRLIRRVDVTAETFLPQAQERLAAGTTEDREAAFELFFEAIQLAPHDVRGYVGVSEAYHRGIRSNDLSPEWSAAAIAFAQKAVSIAPESAHAHFALALAYFRQFWFRQSIEHLRHTWEIEPRTEVAYWLGWMLSEIGELVEDVVWLERARAMEPDFPGLAAEIGYAHRVLENHSEAERWLKRAIDEEDDNPYPHANLLLLYLMQGRDAEAIDHAETLVERYPDEAAFLGNAGLVHWYAGSTDQAKALLEAAADADPMLWIGTWGTIVTQPLGDIYWKEGRREEARTLFANAVAGYRQRLVRASEGWGYRYDLAGIAAVQGQREEAYEWLQDAIDFGWNDVALARRDPMLTSLHDDPRFQQMMAEVEDRVAAMREAATIHFQSYD